MQSNKDKFIRGTFFMEDGELSFTCSTKGATFDEVKEALTKLRDECQRQLNEQHKCPYSVKQIGFKTKQNDRGGN